LVSGFDTGKIHKEILDLDYFVEDTFLSKKGDFLLVTSSDKQFHLYDIVKPDEHNAITHPKLKENKEFNQILKNCRKVEFVPNQNNKTLLFVSENNQLMFCDVGSGSLNPYSLENDVIDFVCLNKKDILVLKKELEIKVLDFESKEFKEQSSYDADQIKRFLSTLIYDKNYSESNKSRT
jgi:WD40 repeat protein